jgi:hypothetical protein
MVIGGSGFAIIAAVWIAAFISRFLTSSEGS